MQGKGRNLALLAAAAVVLAGPSAPSRTLTESNLLHLARERFSDGLSVAEEKMFQAAANGSAAICTTAFDRGLDPANSALWSTNRIIRVDRLAWLCTDSVASALVTSRGVVVVGSRFEGTLDLDWAKIAFPLSLTQCAFTKSIFLRGSQLRALFLDGTHIKDLRADGLSVEGQLSLRNNFSADEDVRLLGAIIGGNLECDGSRIGGVLFADGARIDGAAFLRNGFEVEGGIRFLYATIVGGIDCHGGKVAAKISDGIALGCDGAKIDGSILLNKGFVAEGEVRFPNATIGGGINCYGAQFKKTGTNSVRLNVSGARIGGDLNCNGAQFESSGTNSVCLDASGATIEGNVFLSDGFRAEGEVNLAGVVISRTLACDGGYFINTNGIAIRADRAKVGGSVQLRKGFQAEGSVRFPRALVGADLDCSAGQFSNSNTNESALNAQGATIEGFVFLHYGFKAFGGVDCVGATIGILDCSGGEFINPNTNGHALALFAAKIQGDVFLRDGFGADGKLDFRGVDIGRSFLVRNIESPEKMILDLRSARVGTLRDDAKSWPKVGNLFLDGLVYDRISSPAVVGVESRISWLQRQPSDRFIPQPYEQLAAVLRAMGHEDEATEVMYAKNKDRSRHTHWFSAASFWYHGFGHLIGFGYRPLRPAWISIGCIVFGTIIFSYGKRHGIIGTTDEDRAYPANEPPRPRRLAQDYPGFVAWIYSLESFVPLLNLDMAQHWRPNANRNARFRLGKKEFRISGRFLCLVLVCFKCFGWILTTLWVGAITGLVKT